MQIAGQQKKQIGFTLVEVLVALVVMAVGMLGIAGLYVEGLRAGRTSVYRTTAVNLASDMAARIRLNPRAWATYEGQGPGGHSDCVHDVGLCTNINLAQDDWFHWRENIDASLPAGFETDIEVIGLPSTGKQYNITIKWPETGQAEPVSYTLVLQR